MKWIVFLIFLNSIYFDCRSQGKNAIWCFGDSAGIDFNDTLNPIIFSSSMNAKGSCASISDISGNLKFYCSTPDYNNYWNGVLPLGVIFNREHHKMMNGDSLNCRAWYHEMIIVPDPGDTNLFYIFHIGVTNLYGLYYSVIDMSLDSGRGAVISKNNQLRNEVAVDCLQAIKHGNGRDWWVIFKQAQPSNNEFYMYSITTNGVALDHIDSVGLNGNSNGGDLRFNSTGSQFAFCNLKGLLALYDFDRCSGIITLNKTIRAEDPNGNYPYFFDCCFSPNDSLLYLSCAPYYSDFDTTHIFLYQLQLSSFNPYATKTQIWQQTAPLAIAGVRLGPDNKIYVAAQSTGYPYNSTNYYPENMSLSVINQPDRRGGAVTCDFRPYSFYLGGKRTYWGLPNNPDYDLGPVPGSICDSLSVQVAEHLPETSFTLYPNPAFDKVHVHFSSPSTEKITIKILDTQGSLILQEETNSVDTELDLSKIENGVYFLRIEGEEFYPVQRLVKIN